MNRKDKRLVAVLIVLTILSVILHSGVGPGAEHRDIGMVIADEMHQYYVEEDGVGAAILRAKDECEWFGYDDAFSPFHTVDYLLRYISSATMQYRYKQSVVTDDIYMLFNSDIFIADYVHDRDGKKHLL